MGRRGQSAHDARLTARSPRISSAKPQAILPQASSRPPLAPTGAGVAAKILAGLTIVPDYARFAPVLYEFARTNRRSARDCRYLSGYCRIGNSILHARCRPRSGRSRSAMRENFPSRGEPDAHAGRSAGFAMASRGAGKNDDQAVPIRQSRCSTNGFIGFGPTPMGGMGASRSGQGTLRAWSGPSYGRANLCLKPMRSADAISWPFPCRARRAARRSVQRSGAALRAQCRPGGP